MHENNIAAILFALNLWEFKIPPYGSAVIFELYKNKYNKNYIRVNRKSKHLMSKK